MAKKLKYPYEQWKQEQQRQHSVSPSPTPSMDEDDDEEDTHIDVDDSGTVPTSVAEMELSSDPTGNNDADPLRMKDEPMSPESYSAGKLCYMLHV